MSDFRAQFPFFTLDSQRTAYLDSAASAQKPACVIEAMSDFYKSSYANIHRGVHSQMQKATDAYEAARKATADFVNAPEGACTVFTRGTTEALNLVAHCYGQTHVGEGDGIALATYEHHSNFLPWVNLAQQRGASVELIGLTEEGQLDMQSAQTIFAKGNIKILAIAHISNVLGVISPLEQLIELAHRHGAVVVVDGAQAVAHKPVDFQKLKADFYAFSAHKLYGPTGIGALIMAPGVADKLPPYQFGGGMVHIADLKKATWAPAPYRFEAGTPPIAEAVGMHKAIEFVKNIGWKKIEAHEAELTALLLERLQQLGFVKIYGPLENRIGVVSFNIGEVHPHDVGTILDQDGVAVRVGHHCAQPLMRHYGIDAMVRASIGLYNDINDIDRLVESVKKAHRLFA